MNLGSFLDIQRALDDSLPLLRRSAPKPLLAIMQATASILDIELPSTALEQISAHIETCGPNDRTLNLLIQALQSWDHEEAPWTSQTEPHSKERRALVQRLLGFGEEEQERINKRIPRYSTTDLPIVIAERHKPWYPQRKKDINNFYWRHYSEQLLPPNGSWLSNSVALLEMSIDDVLSRLSDPTLPEIYAVKGLVMGYVQSGKTSHFAGLIAKASDAGYRLIIILAGTLDILRQQTQRRIDKQIIGREMLGDDEYGADGDWRNFVSYGSLPSHRGAFDWERLTSKTDDYKSLRRHLSVLDLARLDKNLPYNHPDNLRSAPARIAVIKKNPSRLDKLCKDLERLTEIRTKLEHVPTLVIDDESDQASINTISPEKRTEKKQRTSTNASIVRLLRLLPRAQYVGYTATPFANVFVDPADAEDLFPKDFIVSLPRPLGYMGAADFHDFGATFDAGDYRGNENAFVRPVVGENTNPTNLPQAIDSFVLSGALKLFRQRKDPSQFGFQHHTMLVHHNSAIAIHDKDYDDVAGIFKYGARYSLADGLAALEKLFESDFRRVSLVRAPNVPTPSTFDELKPFISECLSRICSGKPVRIVNGEGRNRDDTPDFDQSPVWAILVGGTKLSRGYTVEGLTVSYYRRTSGAGDTLMQMGRWFGFRTGYADLVRLFIGRSEKKGNVDIDLYEAFGAICRDEEALRNDLLKYKRDGLTPKQVPPLVRQHAARLPPTSKNKMFNAQIASRDLAGDWEEKTLATSDENEIRENLKSISRLFLSTRWDEPRLLQFRNNDGSDRSFRALIAELNGENVFGFLRTFCWSDGRSPLRHTIDYIAKERQNGKLSTWTVVVPQAEKGATISLPGEGLPRVATVKRKRVDSGRISAFSEPRHREAAAAIAGVATVQDPNDMMSQFNGRGQAVLVVYFVEEVISNKQQITVGFGVQFPGVKSSGAGIVWTVVDPSNAGAIVVSKSDNDDF